MKSKPEGRKAERTRVMPEGYKKEWDKQENLDKEDPDEWADRFPVRPHIITSQGH